MSATGYYLIAPQFSFNNFPEYTSWQTLFRQFKMCGVRTEFIVMNNVAGPTDTTTQVAPCNIEMRYYPRNALQANPTTMLEVCNIRQSKSTFI